MITQFLLDVFFSLVGIILLMLPSVTFQQWFLGIFGWESIDHYKNYMNEIVHYITNVLKGVNYFVPLKEVSIVLMLVLLVANFKMVLWCINWVIRRIADIIP